MYVLYCLKFQRTTAFTKISKENQILVTTVTLPMLCHVSPDTNKITTLIDLGDTSEAEYDYQSQHCTTLRW